MHKLCQGRAAQKAFCISCLDCHLVLFRRLGGVMLETLYLICKRP